MKNNSIAREYIWDEVGINCLSSVQIKHANILTEPNVFEFITKENRGMFSLRTELGSLLFESYKEIL